MATDSATDGGGSALHAAVLAGDTSTVISLRNTSPSLCNAQDGHGRTALVLAAERGRFDLVKELHASTDVAIADKFNRTFLHWACQKINEPAVELETTGAESSIINVQTSSGDTPLHWLLLTARERASIESKEDTEKMPLSKAAEASVVKLTKALLGAGADLELKNRAGISCKDMVLSLSEAEPDLGEQLQSEIARHESLKQPEPEVTVTEKARISVPILKRGPKSKAGGAGKRKKLVVNLKK